MYAEATKNAVTTESMIAPVHVRPSAAPPAFHVIDFSYEEWARLAQSTPLPLTQSDVRRLSALGDPTDLDRADTIYRPLSALLQIYAAEVGTFHGKTSYFLGLREGRMPFVIGIAESMAVGKSTTTHLLRELLRRRPATPRVGLVTTDGFLYPNTVLEERGLMGRKGFPESYNRQSLIDFLKAVKTERNAVRAPVYDHIIYSVIPSASIEVNRPDILIIEGLNVLQPAKTNGSGCDLQTVSSFFDVSVYIDTEATRIEQWYIGKLFKLREVTFNQPESYSQQFATMSEEELHERGEYIWRTIDLLNLLGNTAPARSRVHIVLHKGVNHLIENVIAKKL